jgi:putative oxidoreductase
MLASIFIVQGFDSLLHPDTKAPAAEPVVRPLAERVPVVPDQVEQAVRLNGAVQLVAGSLLAIGRFPRLSAAVLAASLLPTTAAGHRFWESDDKQERTQQKIHLLKNVTILGGLLIAAGDTAGNPSVAWRGRHAAKTARREAALAAKSLQAEARTASAKAEARAAKAAAKTSARAAKAAARGGVKAGKAGGKTGAKAGKLTALLPVG